MVNIIGKLITFVVEVNISYIVRKARHLFLDDADSAFLRPVLCVPSSHVDAYLQRVSHALRNALVAPQKRQLSAPPGMTGRGSAKPGVSPTLVPTQYTGVRRSLCSKSKTGPIAIAGGRILNYLSRIMHLRLASTGPSQFPIQIAAQLSTPNAIGEYSHYHPQGDQLSPPVHSGDICHCHPRVKWRSWQGSPVSPWLKPVSPHLLPNWTGRLALHPAFPHAYAFFTGEYDRDLTPSFVTCMGSGAMSTIKSTMSAYLLSSDTHACGPSPWVVVTPSIATVNLSYFAHDLLSQPIHLWGRGMQFPVSCLTTEMVSDYLSKAFPDTSSLRTRPLTMIRCVQPADGPLRVQQAPTSAALQFSWPQRPGIPVNLSHNPLKSTGGLHTPHVFNRIPGQLVTCWLLSLVAYVGFASRARERVAWALQHLVRHTHTVGLNPWLDRDWLPRSIGQHRLLRSGSRTPGASKAVLDVILRVLGTKVTGFVLKRPISLYLGAFFSGILTLCVSTRAGRQGQGNQGLTSHQSFQLKHACLFWAALLSTLGYAGYTIDTLSPPGGKPLQYQTVSSTLLRRALTMADQLRDNRGVKLRRRRSTFGQLCAPASGKIGQVPACPTFGAHHKDCVISYGLGGLI